MGESSSEETGSMDRAKAVREDKVGKDNGVSRAVAEDDTALLMAAVGSFRKEALGRLRKGSDASRMLDQEMSTRLLHLACKHDAVQCARVLLEGGHGIAASPVDARDQLARTPLHVAAEAHSARCIELLLSKNARTDVRLVDTRPLLALEIALVSRRVQVKWSLDNSIDDLLSCLQEKDLKAVRLLAEKTREVGDVAYRYAMEGRVTALAMLLLVVEEKISAPVSVVIEGVRTKRSIYNSIVDEALSIGDASARDSSERRKALLCEIQLLNKFGAASWRDRNTDKRNLPPLLKAAKVGDMNVTKMLLMGDVDVNEADPEGNTALHWCLSGSSSTQEPRIVWLLLKNGARVFQGNKLGLTPVHSAAAKGNYKALQSLLLHAQDCVDIPSKTKETPLFLAVKNGSVNCVKLLLRFGANTKAQNLRKQRPIDVATSQDMRFILTSANVAPWNHSSHKKNCVMDKESSKEFLGDDFVDYDSDDFNESYTGLKTLEGHRDFRSRNGSAQGGKSKSPCAPKQGSKFVPRPNHWPKHDYTRKIFVGGLPPSVDAEYLTEFFTAQFGPVEEAVVIGLKIGDRMQSRGFGFVKFEREEDVTSAKEAHHLYMLGKRVEVKDAVARGSLPAEPQRTASFRHHNQDVPKVTHNMLDGELNEEHDIRKRRPFPEKCLPSWFFIFRKWLPGFLVDATERLGEKYPLSSLKGDFRAICRMELDHGTLGYPKLSDFMRSLPGICRMCVVPVGSGPATHMVLLPPLSRPKYVPLLEPFSFDHDELPESVSDHQSPRSPLTTNISEDSPHKTDSQQGDACSASESNVQSQQGDECSKINAESQQDSASTDNGSLLSEVTVNTTKPDSIEPMSTGKLDLIEPPIPTGKLDLIEPVPARKPEIFEPVPTRKPDFLEPVPTRKPDFLEPVPTRKPDFLEPVPTRKPDFLEPVPIRKPVFLQPVPTRKPDVMEPALLPQKICSGSLRKTDLVESGLARRIGLIGSRSTTCFVDYPVETAAVTPSNCEAEMRFSFFQSQWDRFLSPYPKSDFCIICRSCEAAMQLVPCLHKICVACMMRCNVRACMVCGTTVSGVKSSPAQDARYPYVGVMERVSDQRCQLMVVCRGAEAIVRCFPCMHIISCRGCLLASVTLLKNCTMCGCMIEHFKFA